MCTNSWYKERPFVARAKTKGPRDGDRPSNRDVFISMQMPDAENGGMKKKESHRSLVLSIL